MSQPLLLSIAEGEGHEPALDGLRGLAVLMVLAHHALLFVSAPFESPMARRYVDFGWAGVPLFFLVSAYTLHRSWDTRVSRESRPILRFYLRRAFRIFPFWWLNLAYAYGNRPIPPEALLANITLTFGFFATTPLWSAVAGGWSLCVEETFYWLFPFWMIRLRSLRTLLIALMCAVGVADLWDTLAPRLLGPMENHEFYFGFPLSRYYVFFLGFLMFRLRNHAGFKEFLSRVGAGRIPWLDLLIGYLALRMVDYGQFFATLTMGLLFLVATNGSTWIGRLVRSRGLGSPGIVCYSMYLLHMPVMQMIANHQEEVFRLLGMTRPEVGELQLAWFLPVAAGLTFGVSVLTYRLVEYPSVMLGRRVLKLPHFSIL